MAAGGAKVAVVDGDGRNSTRTDGAPLPLPEVVPDVSIPRRARNRHVATGRSLASATEATNSVTRSLLEEPGAHGEREHLATLGGCFLQIAMEAISTHCTAVNDGDYASTASRTVPTALAPASCDARAA
jgi:hypothetical protein